MRRSLILLPLIFTSAAASAARLETSVNPREVRVGDRFRTEADHFAPVVTVVGLEGDHVLLDANHPLAGVDLTFDVEIVAVRPATPEEIDRVQNPGAGCACRNGEGQEGCACSDGEGNEDCACGDDGCAHGECTCG